MRYGYGAAGPCCSQASPTRKRSFTTFTTPPKPKESDAIRAWVSRAGAADMYFINVKDATAAEPVLAALTSAKMRGYAQATNKNPNILHCLVGSNMHITKVHTAVERVVGQVQINPNHLTHFRDAPILWYEVRGDTIIVTGKLYMIATFLMDEDSFAANEVATAKVYAIPLDAANGADQFTVITGLQTLCNEWGWALRAGKAPPTE